MNTPSDEFPENVQPETQLLSVADMDIPANSLLEKVRNL